MVRTDPTLSVCAVHSNNDEGDTCRHHRADTKMSQSWLINTVCQYCLCVVHNKSWVAWAEYRNASLSWKMKTACQYCLSVLQLQHWSREAECDRWTRRFPSRYAQLVITLKKIISTSHTHACTHTHTHTLSLSFSLTPLPPPSICLMSWLSILKHRSLDIFSGLFPVWRTAETLHLPAIFREMKIPQVFLGGFHGCELILTVTLVKDADQCWLELYLWSLHNTCRPTNRNLWSSWSVINGWFCCCTDALKRK